MHRELLSHPYISSYRTFLVLGFFFGYLLARWHAKRGGIERRHVDNILLLLPIVGLAGARFFSRLFYYPEPLTFWQALKVWEDGGLVFYGGVIFGVLTVITYALVRRISLAALADVLAPALALGLAFGRIGCFMAGCCWGDLCGSPDQMRAVDDPLTRSQIQTIPALSWAGFPLAVTYPPEAGAYEQHQTLGLIPAKAMRSLPVHPVQLYEAFCVFALCYCLHRAASRKRFDGEVICLLAIGYGCLRFALEFLRADSRPIYFGGTTISQFISITIITAAMALYLGLRYRSTKVVRCASALA